MYCRFTFVFLVVFVSSIAAQTSPPIQFQHSMGGSLDDIAYDISQTNDGGFITCGGSTSSDGDLLKTTDVQHGGNYDYWFAKLDPALNFQWKKHLGGTGSDVASTIFQLGDGGYIIGGNSNSNDLDVSGNHGIEFDFWIVKLFSSGTTQWQKCLGGSGYEDFGAMRATADGGFILAGGAQSNDGDVSGNHGSSDFWLVKTDGAGVIQWQKCYGGTDYEKAADVRVCTDGGYLMVGFSESNSGDVTGNHGDYDIWVVKTDASGNLQWQRSLGGSGYDAANGCIALADGSFIVCGYTGSSDGDVSNNQGDDDAWIIKLDSGGGILWSQCLGGSDTDVAAGIEATTDNGFMVACYSKSGDGAVGNNYGFWDYWAVKTDAAGSIEWQKNFGGSLNDVCYAAKPTSDEGYILTGYSESQGIDVSGNHGKKDFWVVKLQGVVGVNEVLIPEIILAVYPQPASGFFNVKITGEALNNYSQLTLDIIDIAGRTLHSQPVVFDAIVKVDCSLWSSGIYCYRLRNETKVLGNDKFVIQ
ncbi:MAG TPA: T9SS type A sorting domain-containing protein [Chitinophagales bacterium]|nr:T9SS type A sorting domain-containing protein [Chitinophagales bacterium]